ncbi:DUF3102 domain-containing protein [Chloroflexota bacterium]
MDINHVGKQNVRALELLNLRESTEKIRELSKWTVQGMVEIGTELKWVKANLEHGKFEKWIIEELPFSPSTARRFMRAADMNLNCALTHDLDVVAINRQIWGNTLTGSNNKTQQDLYKWLDKEIVKTENRFYRLVRQLSFCNNLTPDIKEKLHDMVQGLIDMDKSIQSG